MKTYKTLKQLLLKTENRRVTAQQVINKRCYIKGEGWTSFKLKDDVIEQVAESVSLALGGQSKTKDKVKRVLMSKTPQHWGLERVQISLRKDHKDKRKYIIVTSYVAGQDYGYETNTIRTDLKNK